MTAQHAEPVLTNVLLKLFQKVTFMLSILMYALTAVHAQMFARLKQLNQNKHQSVNKINYKEVPHAGLFFML